MVLLGSRLLVGDFGMEVLGALGCCFGSIELGSLLVSIL